MRVKSMLWNTMRKELETVALLVAFPEAGLARGQVGTVVDVPTDSTALVEFSGDDGRAYAIVPCPRAELLVLHYVAETATRFSGGPGVSGP